MTTRNDTYGATRTWKQRLKPLAGWFGIHASAHLWQALAARAYQRKLDTDRGFRQWFEHEAPRWVADHWTQGLPMGFFSPASVPLVAWESTSSRRAPRGSRPTDSSREKLPFRDKAFDYVICCETLEHVCNPIHMLNELSRVCRGRLHISILWLPRTQISSRPSGWPETESHIFEFSEEDFAKVLSHTRLRLAHRERVLVFPAPRSPMASWWLSRWMYPVYVPLLQYYELQPC